MTALTSQEQDFPSWYQEVIAKAELAENGPVRGTMIIHPYGWAIWENMQADMNRRIQELEVDNCYFPLFIPESYLQKESEHIEGFAPELAIVTQGGGKELEEVVIVRPTSETLFGTYMAKWIDSYRDLPLKLNQWANVVRWEMRTRLFLRTSEFLWQEGHTAHISQAEAAEFAQKVLLETYTQFFKETCSLPVLTGIKPPSERFAGAINTMTCEAMMRDGKALQNATSHELGQNFSRSFDISYLSQNGSHELVWTTSWGSSTRMMGGLIMAHGDDRGLKIPPQLAPIQVIILPIKSDDESCLQVADKILQELKHKGIRAKLSNRDGWSFGRRATDAEIKGIPLRIEIGPRDLAENKVTLVKRNDASKNLIDFDKVTAVIPELLTQISQEMYDEALKFLTSHTQEVDTIEQAISATKEGFARLPWKVVDGAGEKTLNEYSISVRLLQTKDGSVPQSPDEPDLFAIVAKAY